MANYGGEVYEDGTSCPGCGRYIVTCAEEGFPCINDESTTKKTGEPTIRMVGIEREDNNHVIQLN